MSIAALSWAFRQDIKPSSLKFLLVALANYANEQAQAWASIDTLCKVTCQNKKTVAAGLLELERRDILRDTAKRMGKTNSIKIYTLAGVLQSAEILGGTEAYPKTGQLEKHTQKRLEAYPKTAGSIPENGNPPAPPIKNNLKEPKRTKSKSVQVTLVKWEENIGSKLCVQQIATWVKENRLHPGKVAVALDQFREKMLASAKEYADFHAAFRNYLKSGWLSCSMDSLRLEEKPEPTRKLEFFDKGLTL